MFDPCLASSLPLLSVIPFSLAKSPSRSDRLPSLPCHCLFSLLPSLPLFNPSPSSLSLTLPSPLPPILSSSLTMFLPASLSLRIPSLPSPLSPSFMMPRPRPSLSLAPPSLLSLSSSQPPCLCPNHSSASACSKIYPSFHQLSYRYPSASLLDLYPVLLVPAVSPPSPQPEHPSLRRPLLTPLSLLMVPSQSPCSLIVPSQPPSFCVPSHLSSTVVFPSSSPVPVIPFLVTHVSLDLQLFCSTCPHIILTHFLLLHHPLHAMCPSPRTPCLAPCLAVFFPPFLPLQSPSITHHHSSPAHLHSSPAHLHSSLAAHLHSAPTHLHASPANHFVSPTRTLVSPPLPKSPFPTAPTWHITSPHSPLTASPFAAANPSRAPKQVCLSLLHILLSLLVSPPSSRHYRFLLPPLSLLSLLLLPRSLPQPPSFLNSSLALPSSDSSHQQYFHPTPTNHSRGAWPGPRHHLLLSILAFLPLAVLQQAQAGHGAQEEEEEAEGGPQQYVSVGCEAGGSKALGTEMEE
ncbi:unnamed protein product [Closterium sp. NIES-64]|nr:unnamed protein product [Closterium sp. NIES-64]